MKPDRPLILSVLCLATGIGLILGYCHDNSNFAAAYPFAGTMLHVDFSTAGPGVLGGMALLGVGLLLLAWSFIAAIVNQVGMLGDAGAPPERLLD